LLETIVNEMTTLLAIIALERTFFNNMSSLLTTLTEFFRIKGGS